MESTGKGTIYISFNRIISCLWKSTNQDTVINKVRSHKWKWIGHILKKLHDKISWTLLDCTQGSRRRGRPLKTWRRRFAAEVAEACYTWSEIKTLAMNRSKRVKLCFHVFSKALSHDFVKKQSNYCTFIGPIIALYAIISYQHNLMVALHLQWLWTIIKTFSRS